MTKRLFITGTDTNCGKTYATSLLLKHLVQNSMRAYAIKPVLTGFIAGEPNDVTRLIEVNSHTHWPVNTVSYPLPVSPHIAAAKAGSQITLEQLTEAINQPCFNALDYLLIEGAGGLMVPLTEQITWLDVISQLELSVVMVVGMRLGCLNHTFLTLHALKTHDIHIEGLIINQIDRNMLCYEENVDSIKRMTDMAILGEIAYNGATLRLTDNTLLSYK
jgi:dethiobiotin synthetase